MSQVGVHPVSEIQRRGSLRQHLDLALGREYEHLVYEYIRLDRFQELLSAQVLLPLDELTEPGQLAVERRIRCAAFLVAPVGGDAEAGYAMHLLRSYLNFERHAAFGENGGMQRLVA